MGGCWVRDVDRATSGAKTGRLEVGTTVVAQSFLAWLIKSKPC